MPSCCRHSSLDSSRSCVSSTVAARISDSFAIQLNFLILARLRLTNCKGLHFYSTVYDKTELFRLTLVFDRSSKTKGACFYLVGKTGIRSYLPDKTERLSSH